MTRTRHQAERETGPLTPKPAKPGLSDEEVAWRLHQELNAFVGSPALRTRTRHHDAEVREASPSISKAGQEETPSAVRVTRSRAREPEEDKPAVSHRPTTRGVRTQMPLAVSSQSGSDVDRDDQFDDGSGEGERPPDRVSTRGDITEDKKGASSAPGKARMPKIPKLPMVLQDDGSWYRARVIRDSAERVLVEFTGFEHQFPSLWLAKVDERIWRGSYKGKDWKYLGGGAWAPKQARSSTAPSSGRLAGKKRPRPTGVPQQEDEGRRLQEEETKSHLEGEEEEGVEQSMEGAQDIKVDAEEAGGKPVGKVRGGGNRRLLDPIIREALARGESLMISLDDEGPAKEGGAPTAQHTTRGSHPGAKEMASSLKKNQDVTGRATTRMKRKRDGRPVASTLVSVSHGRTPTPETPLGRSSRRTSLLLPSPAGGEKLRSWREDEGTTTKGVEEQDDCVVATDGDGASLGKQKHSQQVEETGNHHGNASSHSRASHQEEGAAHNKQTTPVPAPRRRRKPATCSRAPTGMELDAIACSPTSKARLAKEAAALAELERRLEEEEQARERDCAVVRYPAEEEVSVAGAVRSGENRDIGDGALMMMMMSDEQPELLVPARSWRGESGGREEDLHRNNNDDDRSSGLGAATASRRQRRKAAGRARVRTSTWSYELAEEHGRQDHFVGRYEETRRQTATTISRLERKRGRPSNAQHRRARHQEDGLLLSKGVFNTILGALSSFAGEAPPLPAISRRGEAWGSAVGPTTPVAAAVGAGSHSSLTLFNSWNETRWHKAGDSGAQPRILRVKEELFTPRASSVSSGVSPFDQSVAAPPLPLFQ